MSSQTLKKPILSEKAYKLMAANIYTFFVSRHARKEEIASEIEKQFSVKVKKVNITSQAQKKKRIGKTRKFADVGGGKKAIVWLAAGQKIDILSPKAEKQKKQSDKKDVQKASPAGRQVKAESKEG